MNSYVPLASRGLHPANNIQSALESAIKQLDTSSSTARLDAEILLSHILGKNRSFLRAWPESELATTQIKQYQKLIEARKQSTPIAYLTGQREFWSNNFAVNPNVLVPRPETELLVEMALEVIPSNQSTSILELGTGSGIIGISLAMERPNVSVLATDICSAALNTARHNAKEKCVSNIDFQSSNWFESISAKKYDLIISNPPYIAEGDPHLMINDLVFEPDIALKSGPSGMEALSTIAKHARNWLNPGGHLMLEHGYQQASDLHEILSGFGYNDTKTRHDLQGHLRATQCRWERHY